MKQNKNELLIELHEIAERQAFEELEKELLEKKLYAELKKLEELKEIKN